MTKTIQIPIPSGANGFAEDKDEARKLRKEKILPVLDKGQRLTLDFSDVRYATQSYVHALLGEALQKFGDPVLDSIEFKDCSPSVQSVIELVVDYSLGGFSDQGAA